MIRDNYFENGTANVLTAVIDASKDGLTGIGDNPSPTELFHVDITGNRIDVDSTKATNTYIIDDTFLSLNLVDVSTVGAIHAPSVFTDVVLARYSITHVKKININNCKSFGRWNNFKGSINNRPK